MIVNVCEVSRANSRQIVDNQFRSPCLAGVGEVYQDKRIKSNGVCIQEFIKLMHPHDLAKRSSGRVEEPYQSVDG